MEAICAIEQLSRGISRTDGTSLIGSPAYYQYFCRMTRGKTLYCDKIAYDNLPQELHRDRDRNIVLINTYNIFPLKSIIVGGKDAFEYYESKIDTWYICWYAKKFDGITSQNLVRYQPDLKDFQVVSSESDGFICYNIYKRKNKLRVA